MPDIVAIEARFKVLHGAVRRMASNRFAQEFVQPGVFHSALVPNLEALGYLLMAMASSNHTLPHLPLVLLHARVIAVTVVSQRFAIGVGVGHVSDLRSVNSVGSIFAILLQIIY